MHFREKNIANERKELVNGLKNRLYTLDERTDRPGPRSKEIILNAEQKDKEMRSMKEIFR